MECVSVKSRLISSVTYYADSRELLVWFHTGQSQTHENIDPVTFRNLVTAESPGYYYRTFIALVDPKPKKARKGIFRFISAFAVCLGLLGAPGLFLKTHTHQHVAATETLLR